MLHTCAIMEGLHSGNARYSSLQNVLRDEGRMNARIVVIKSSFYEELF
jgi:hypothetical protein